jgi:hypothetical protein
VDGDGNGYDPVTKERMSVAPSVRLAVLLGGVLLGAPALGTAQEGGAAVAPALASPGTGVAAHSTLATPGVLPAARPLRAGELERIADRWGIRIEGLRLTAAGYMLDFRYTVLDPAKAEPLFARKSKPVLTDEKTGAVMAVPVPPKTGALRPSNDPKVGRTYFMFFANPGHFIQRSSPVTVTIGDFSVSGLIVK